LFRVHQNRWFIHVHHGKSKENMDDRLMIVEHPKIEWMNHGKSKKKHGCWLKIPK
jgi:hypothetical protein